MQNNTSSQKGVSLIITLFIMVIILAVVLSISALLYSEIKIIKNIGNSTGAFYAAESGIEKVLYFDNQVAPIPQQSAIPCTINADCSALPGYTCSETDGVCETSSVRGLCTMYSYNVTNPNACQAYSGSGDKSLYCQPATGYFPPQVGVSDLTAGCRADVCDDCNLAFSTNLDNGASYYVSATVQPSSDKSSSNFEVTSKGTFGQAQREIQISVMAAKPKEAIGISNDCVSPDSNGQNETIHIQAEVVAELPEPIATDSVGVYISDANGTYYDASGNVSATKVLIPMTLNSGNANDGYYALDWTTNNIQSYSVYVDAKNTISPPDEYTTPDPLPVCNF